MFSSRALSRSFAAPLVVDRGAGFVLRNARTGEVLVRALEGAFTRATRRRGLLGRAALPAGAGLLIAPCSSIHTVAMRFPIDVLFLSRDGQVRKIARAVPPWRLVFGWGAFAVLELPAHAASATDAGDRLVVASAVS